MHRFKFFILISMCVILSSFGISQVGFASGDSSSLGLSKLTPQTLQPTTVSTSASKPIEVKPDAKGNVVCPEGYALTKFQSTAESHSTVTVYTECNGASVAGYVHTWCGNGAKNYYPSVHAPTVSYTCQKIQNQWVAAKN